MRKLEKLIEPYLEKYRDISKRYYMGPSVQKRCEQGMQSVLNTIYGLDVDESKEVIGFRSEKENPEDMEFEWKWNGEGNLETEIQMMMEEIRKAVNHSCDARANSFSKGMAPPLFKYYNTSRFMITKLQVNTIRLHMLVECENWNGESGISYDSNGNECERYHTESIEFPVSMREMNSTEKVSQYMWEALDGELSAAYVEERGKDGKIIRDYLMNITGISFWIAGFTIDISDFNRKDLDDYYLDNRGSQFKRHASYKADREILSSDHGDIIWDIRNKDIIEFLRFVYLLKIHQSYKEFEEVVNQILDGEWSDVISFSEQDKKGMRWFQAYWDEAVTEKERKRFCGSFEFLQYSHDVHRMKKILAENDFKKKYFTNEKLLSWMMEKANL